MNVLKKWWQTGEVGSLNTNVQVEDKTLVKVAVTVILVFLLVYISYKIISKKAK